MVAWFIDNYPVRVIFPLIPYILMTVRIKIRSPGMLYELENALKQSLFFEENSIYAEFWWRRTTPYHYIQTTPWPALLYRKTRSFPSDPSSLSWYTPCRYAAKNQAVGGSGFPGQQSPPVIQPDIQLIIVARVYAKLR